MTISANFPNVQPSLLLDFANAKQLPPQVTFTRATSATYYDGSTTAMAEQNLLTYSQSLADWGLERVAVTTDSTTAPDGSSTADTLTTFGDFNHSVFSNALYVTVGIPYTFSVYAKKNGSDFVQLSWYDGGFANAYANFDLNAGTVGTAAGCTSTITSVGNGWYRCTMTATATVSINGRAYLTVITSSTAARFEPYTATTQSIFAWGYQLEQRSAATAYTATTTQPITNYVPVLLTAGGGQPRFDHNPTTSESLGLLIEEQRTNLVSNSVYAGSNWAAYGGTLTQNYTISPDASQTACQISSTGFVTTRINTGSLVSGITYTASIWMKSNTSSNQTISLQIGDNIVQSCTVTPQWQRFIGVGTPTNTGYNFLDLESVDSNISAWGAQLEQASFATSYIPTIGLAATRAADFASMTGTNFSSWYSQGEGTMYGELSSSLTTGFRLLTFSDGTTNNQNWISENSAAIYRNADYQYYASGFNLGNNGKIAMTYAPDDAQNAVNGTYGSVDGTVNLANNLTTALIGANASLDVGSLTIKKLAFYPQRLSQTNLQALTS